MGLNERLPKAKANGRRKAVHARTAPRGLPEGVGEKKFEWKCAIEA